MALLLRLRHQLCRPHNVLSLRPPRPRSTTYGEAATFTKGKGKGRPVAPARRAPWAAPDTRASSPNTSGSVSLSLPSSGPPSAKELLAAWEAMFPDSGGSPAHLALEANIAE